MIIYVAKLGVFMPEGHAFSATANLILGMKALDGDGVTRDEEEAQFHLCHAARVVLDARRSGATDTRLVSRSHACARR